MARYRATIQGNRGQASRLGTTASGITARVNGWNVGVLIHDSANGEEDAFDVYATGGSNGRLGALIGTVKLDSHGLPAFFPHSVECFPEVNS